MNYYNGSTYEVLYPNITASNVVNFKGENPLLSDNTKTLYGLQTTATPDDIFVQISNTTNIKPTYYYGSYIGTGTYGESNPTTLHFSFTPKVILFFSSENFDNTSRYPYLGGYYQVSPIITLFDGQVEYSCFSDSSNILYMKPYVRISNWSTTVSFYTFETSTILSLDKGIAQLNGSGITYFYLALG